MVAKTYYKSSSGEMFISTCKKSHTKVLNISIKKHQCYSIGGTRGKVGGSPKYLEYTVCTKYCHNLFSRRWESSKIREHFDLLVAQWEMSVGHQIHYNHPLCIMAYGPNYMATYPIDVGTFLKQGTRGNVS